MRLSNTSPVPALVALAFLTACGSDVGTISEPAPTRLNAVDAQVSDVSLTDVFDAGAEVDVRKREAAAVQAAAPCSDWDRDADVSTPRPFKQIADVLYALSDDCLGCAATRCAMSLETCSSMPGCAESGPAAGVSRAGLCAETAECLLSSSCVSKNPAQCLCDSYTFTSEVDVSCSEAGLSCRSQLIRAMETTNVPTILSSFRDITTGGGAATMLLQCLVDQRCTACLNGPSDAGRRDRDAAIVQPSDSGIDANEVTEPSAETGPPGAVCGNGIIEANEKCDDGNHLEDGTPIEKCVPSKEADPAHPGLFFFDCDQCSPACTDNTACNACLRDQCNDFMNICEGVDNPATKAGADRIAACHKVYACVIQHGCADPALSNPTLACYCGAAIVQAGGDPQAECAKPDKAVGACKSEIEDAFGTQNPTTILNAYTDITTPGGAAMSRVLCETSACADTCYYGRLRPALNNGGAPDAAH